MPGLNFLTALLREQGVGVLRNQSTVVRLGDQEVLLVGLDDLEESSIYGKPTESFISAAEFRRRVAGIDWYSSFDTDHPNLVRIVLGHNPDIVYLPGRQPDVMLAGHTHGGQVFLLDWIAPLFPRFLYRVLPGGSFITRAGRFRIGGRTLIISRGMECSAFPLRLLRVPEAIVVTLQSAGRG